MCHEAVDWVPNRGADKGRDGRTDCSPFFGVVQMMLQVVSILALRVTAHATSHLADPNHRLHESLGNV